MCAAAGTRDPPGRPLLGDRDAGLFTEAVALSGNHLGVRISGTGQMPSPATGSDLWRLDDRIALVTGASAGLGARFVRVLHRAGAHVLATARRADLLDDLARQCGEWMK